MITLRPYQLDAMQSARDRIASGRRAPLIVSPTGSGKSAMASAIIAAHLAKSEANRVLVVAHRRELIEQMAKTLIRSGVPMVDIGQIMPGVIPRPSARVQVASVQTLRARKLLPTSSLVIYDECVTGDTMIGGARADTIHVGDLVPSWSDERKSVVWRKVSRVFVNQAASLLVLRVAGHALTCTPAHPIWVAGKGYAYAGDVVIGDVCRVRGTVTERRAWARTKDVQQGVRVKADDRKETKAAPVGGSDLLGLQDASYQVEPRQVAADMLARVLERDSLSYGIDHESHMGIATDVDSQSDEQSGDPREDGRHAAQDRPPSPVDGRQGSRHDGAAAIASDGAGSRVDGGASNRSEGSFDESPTLHLFGSGSRGDGICDRGGRRFARNVEIEGFRSSEDDVPQFARVDSVEILEPGSDGSFGGRAPKGRVYNFEVEGEHNFFANGILTHNCHHYSSDDWNELTKAYPGVLRIGFTATPMRSDGRGMAPAFDSLVVVSTIKELTALGHLVACKVIAPAKPLRKPNLSHSPVDAYLAHAKGMRTVVFADFIVNAEKFVAEFREKEIDACIIHGSLADDERKRALLAHSNGAVLVNCMVLTEGWDSPETSCCILARGCGSVGTYLQIVGRVLRPCGTCETCAWALANPTKNRQACIGKEALLIDLTGRSFYDHGAPDADRTYSLTGKGIRKKDESEDLGPACPVCGQPIVPGEPCAVCGFLAEGSSQIEEPRYTGDELAERYAGKRSEDDDKRIDTLARWYAEAKARKHQPWAATAKYEAVYGAKPTTSIQVQAEALARTLACVTCNQCQKVTARTYSGGKCGRCAFGGKKKTG